MPFNGSDLGWLMFECVETKRIADADLKRSNDQHHPHRH
jgi:hypothetical protein